MAPVEKQPGGGISGLAIPHPAHTLTVAEVLKHIPTNPDTGLDTTDANQRLSQHGLNELEPGAGVQPLRIFIEQVFNAMTLILLLALGASFGIQAWIEGGILGVIIIFNIFLGFFQTLQAEKTIESLKTLGSPNATVLRDGQMVTLPTSGIVRVFRFLPNSCHVSESKYRIGTRRHHPSQHGRLRASRHPPAHVCELEIRRDGADG